MTENIYSNSKLIVFEYELKIYLFWQHHGNKKSDSLYYLNNEKNANTLS